MVISSPLSPAFQMFSYFILAKNAKNCPENNSISRKSSNTEFTMYNCHLWIQYIFYIQRMAISSSHGFIYVLFVCLFFYRWLQKAALDWLSDACWIAERMCIKGTWQWGGFSGVFAEISSSWVPYTTFRTVPILASNLRRYSYLKNDSPQSSIWGVADSLYRWVGEWTTPRITDTESRLLNFFKRKLSVSMIRRVFDSSHQWYGESPTPCSVESESRQLPRITDTESRRIRVSLSWGVDDSAYRWYGESYSIKNKFSFDFRYFKWLKHAFKGSLWPKICLGCNVLSQ
jgi:hypothetical protein